MLFLGNIDPELQMDVLNQVERPRIVACDTMNFWIHGKREALWKVLEKIDVLVINDGEARELGQDFSLVKVAKDVLARGPKYFIIKRGEYGVLMFHEKGVFGAPAFPLEMVKDPTGAGDTFAGRVYGAPVFHGRFLRCRLEAGDYFRKRDGFIYRGGLQSRPLAATGISGHRIPFPGLQAFDPFREPVMSTQLSARLAGSIVVSFSEQDE